MANYLQDPSSRSASSFLGLSAGIEGEVLSDIGSHENGLGMVGFMVLRVYVSVLTGQLPIFVGLRPIRQVLSQLPLTHSDHHPLLLHCGNPPKTSPSSRPFPFLLA